jgi:integrase
VSTAPTDLRLDGTFIRYLEAQYRPSTVYVYRRAIERFVDFMRGRPLSMESVMRFIDSLGPGERPVYAYAIRTYLNYSGHESLARQIPVPRGSYTQMSMQAWLPWPLVKYMADHTSSPKLAAMMAVAYDLALRRNELRMLNRVPMANQPYINLSNGKAVVYRMKTRQYPWQQLWVSKWALAHLHRYLRTRTDDGEALFVNPAGERLSSSAIDAFVRSRLRSEFGVDGISVKTFRHSKLTWMAVEGHSLIDIAKWAGHTTPNPTLTYIHAAERFRTDPLSSIEFLKGTPIYRIAVELLEDHASHA